MRVEVGAEFRGLSVLPEKSEHLTSCPDGPSTSQAGKKEGVEFKVHTEDKAKDHPVLFDDHTAKMRACEGRRFLGDHWILIEENLVS